MYYKKSDAGVSPVVGAILVIALIMVLAAVVVPVAINTFTDFAVQEKKTVGVTVNINDSILTANIVNGKDKDELSEYEILILNEDGTVQNETGKSSIDSHSAKAEVRVFDPGTASRVNIVGTFVDGRSEVIFSGLIKPGYVVVQTDGVLVIFHDTDGSVLLQTYMNPGEKISYTRTKTDSDNRQYRVSGWKYEGDDDSNKVTHVPSDLAAGSELHLYAIWKEVTSTGVVVQYYLQNINDDSYQLVSTDYTTFASTTRSTFDTNSVGVSSDANAPVTWVDGKPVGFAMPSKGWGSDVTVGGNTLPAYDVKFAREKYTVSYVIEGTGPDATLPADKEYKYESDVKVIDNLADAEKDGKTYHFAGWSVHKKGDADTSISVREQEFVMPAFDVVVSGSWTTNPVVTFDAAGGEFADADGGGSEVIKIADDEKKVEVPADPEREGYTFEKWVRLDDENNELDVTVTDDGKIENVTESYTVHAKWSASGYKVTFSVAYYNIGETLAFADFDYDSAAEPTVNSGAGSVKDGSSTSVVTVENVAYGTLITVNGENTSEITIGEDTYTAVVSSAYTEETGRFGRWTIDGGLLTGDSVDGDLTITAVFLVRSDPDGERVVALNNMNAKTESNPTEITVTAAGTLKDSANEKITTLPTRTGYTFGGYWTEENGGGTQHYDEGGNWLGTAIAADISTLYAKWTAKGYTFKYAKNTDSTTSVTIQPLSEQVEFTIDEPKNHAKLTAAGSEHWWYVTKGEDKQVTGYTYTSSKGGGTKYTLTVMGSGSGDGYDWDMTRSGSGMNKTTTYTYKGPGMGTYKLTDIKEQSGGGGRGGQTTYTRTETTVTISSSVKYYFLGWSTSNSDDAHVDFTNGLEFTLDESNLAEYFPDSTECQLYGKWKEYYGTVTFNSNGGTFAETDSNANYQIIIETTPQTSSPVTGYLPAYLPKPSKDDTAGNPMIFMGWGTATDGSNLVSAGPKTNTNREISLTGSGTNYGTTLYALWNQDWTFDATFKPNGGTFEDGTSADKQFTGLKATDTIDVPQLNDRTGYVFCGWQKSGGSAIVIDKDTVSVSGSQISSNSGDTSVTLEAVWKEKVTVTFHRNADTDASYTQDFVSGEAQQLNANTFAAPTGKSFAGWATEAAGSVVYNDEQKITITSDTDLYAVWSSGYRLYLKASTSVSETDTGKYVSADKDFKLGDYIACPFTGFTSTNEAIYGWKAKDGNTYDWTDTITQDNLSSIADGDKIVLTAQWTYKLTNVTFKFGNIGGSATNGWIVPYADYTYAGTISDYKKHTIAGCEVRYLISQDNKNTWTEIVDWKEDRAAIKAQEELWGDKTKNTENTKGNTFDMNGTYTSRGLMVVNSTDYSTYYDGEYTANTKKVARYPPVIQWNSATKLTYPNKQWNYDYYPVTDSADTTVNFNNAAYIRCEYTVTLTDGTEFFNVALAYSTSSSVTDKTSSLTTTEKAGPVTAVNS